MIKAGLNIGNSKISCVVADYKSQKNINFLSMISIPTSNIKKNIILNYENLTEEIKKLIFETEKQSQTKLNSLNLNISLIDSTSHYFSSQTNLDHEKISDLHIKKIINNSEYFEHDKDKFEIMNNIISFEVDKNYFYSIPIGNYSNHLKINFYKLLVQKKYLDNLNSLLKNIKINIENYIPSPLSSSLATLTNDEKELGTICLDFGHSTTSIAIYENKKLIYADSLGIGSNNITLDIARGVSTNISSAERLKTLYGSLLSSPSDEHEIIEIPNVSGENNQFRQINRSFLNSIIKPRMEETLEIVWQRIKQNNLHSKKIKNIIITGGGSQLEGIEEYAKIIFSSNVRIAKPKESLNIDPKFKKAIYSDIIGTILFESDQIRENYLDKTDKKRKKASISGFFSWLDQYI